ncbi:DHA2 family methylenomycin A resistance protein-like MFS transporter [Streptomyces sp. 3211.6]|uniref:MFS transporter n=1 Tax=Streptomyces TaxID=1883 RepID=UPI0009A51DEA|nr:MULTISPECIES: MFS transporter [Streptomyces]RKT06063.1 DHA2 family methylenomycin A resistance protein-like MFS transporter [Streptomyces sp. 3211.6]RPF46397.1 DHA2 family methylenomycin A resistance protein-like MFS transporter [Streptomyces sp. Ag109_G2-6]
MAAPHVTVGSRSNRAVLLTVTCLGQFMVLLDNTIVGAALPDMQHRLHTQLTGLQWIVDAYVLLVAMLLLSGGVFADRFGRKRVYLSGVAVFTAASLVCSLAPSLGWLVAGRVLQGIGAAALSPASLALLAAAHPVPQERVKAIGLWAGFSGIGLAAGPVAGGVLTDAFGWPAIFLVNLPIGVVLLLVGLRTLEEARNPGAPAIDVPGTVLSVLGVGVLTYALIEGGARGWTSPVILGGFAAAVVLLAAFVAVEARRSAPMLPLRLFRQRLFTVSNTAMVVVGFALMGSSFFFSQFFVYVQGSSILRAGLQTLPVSLAMVIVSPYAGRLAARYGFRIVVTGGLVLAGLGLLALGTVHADTGYGNVWWRLGAVGAGFALTMSPLTGAAIQAVSPQEGGLASGISSTTRQIGAVLGVAVLGAVVRTRQSGGASFETGLNSAFVAAGAVTLATAVFTGLWSARSRAAEGSVATGRSTEPEAVSPSNVGSAHSS